MQERIEALKWVSCEWEVSPFLLLSLRKLYTM